MRIQLPNRICLTEMLQIPYHDYLQNIGRKSKLFLYHFGIEYQNLTQLTK